MPSSSNSNRLLVPILIGVFIVLVGVVVTAILIKRVRQRQTSGLGISGLASKSKYPASNAKPHSVVVFYNKKSRKLEYGTGSENMNDGYYVMLHAEHRNPLTAELYHHHARLQGMANKHKNNKMERERIHRIVMNRKSKSSAENEMLQLGSAHLLGDCSQSNCWSCNGPFGNYCDTGDCCVCSECDHRPDSCIQCASSSDPDTAKAAASGGVSGSRQNNHKNPKAEILFSKDGKVSKADGSETPEGNKAVHFMAVSDEHNRDFQNLLREHAKLQGMVEMNKTNKDVRKHVHKIASTKKTHSNSNSNDRGTQLASKLLRDGSGHLLGDCGNDDCWSCFVGCSSGDCCVCSICSVYDNCADCPQCSCPPGDGCISSSALCTPCENILNGVTATTCSATDPVGEELCSAFSEFSFVCDALVDAACNAITNGSSPAAACNAVVGVTPINQCCQT